MNEARDLSERGRAAFAARVWDEAFALLSAADRAGHLEPSDLDRLATAAYLVGRDDESQDIAARSFRGWLRSGDSARAVRRAFWLGLHLLLDGDETRGQAWLARAAELLPADGGEPERGYLLTPEALHRLDEGDAAASHAISAEVLAIGERHDDLDLVALGRLGVGQALVELGEVGRGVAALDEVMVAVTTDDVSPQLAGIVYCAVIETCQRVLDVRRAREWTAALTRWCDAQPGLVPYRGQCLVHRAEIMRLHGEWSGALDEARSACGFLDGSAAAGAAYYQLAELRRLRGEFADAEDGYRAASRWVADPQPGIALLRLAQGRVDAAAAASRRALEAAHGRADRSRLLGAHAQIMLACGDVGAARAAADELRVIDEVFAAPLLHAQAEQADGACLLAEGDAATALGVLRRAWAVWQDLDAPYEAALVRVLIAQAHRLLGEPEPAEMELETAAWMFDQLGAGPDARRARALSERAAARGAGGLTRREVEVLRLVATGMTNRAVATELFLSERTVARHVSNIFTKLDVSSRSAATAYAYQHGLV
ncbi:helix-turn-helix transcriptional regulator [Jiangella alkaliphila]|uniref:Regulatory protein, luxR family n=1 Tax=Jiangella alkaliphila TaxID=419479 RepID=A0A1H2LBI7_9ACTN|nr:helix-turn-helix transcriptional regulator [Jiangella alkaliphila]SDU78202.1 regulatory protein, luxR family [Jiangella alkaliphila]